MTRMRRVLGAREWAFEGRGAEELRARRLSMALPPAELESCQARMVGGRVGNMVTAGLLDYMYIS